MPFAPCLPQRRSQGIKHLLAPTGADKEKKIRPLGLPTSDSPTHPKITPKKRKYYAENDDTICMQRVRVRLAQVAGALPRVREVQFSHRGSRLPRAREEGAERLPFEFHPSHPLREVQYERYERISSGIGLDIVLGGGIVRGSLVLVGGDPGVGKSTLLTQVAAHLAAEHKVLYLSAEESCSQVKLRCERLGVGGGGMLLLNETCLDASTTRKRRSARRNTSSSTPSRRSTPRL